MVVAPCPGPGIHPSLSGGPTLQRHTGSIQGRISGFPREPDRRTSENSVNANFGVASGPLFYSYSAKCVEKEFSELRLLGILRNSHTRSSRKFATASPPPNSRDSHCELVKILQLSDTFASLTGVRCTRYVQKNRT